MQIVKYSLSLINSSHKYAYKSNSCDEIRERVKRHHVSEDFTHVNSFQRN